MDLAAVAPYRDAFLLAFVRIGALLAVAPIFGHRSIPVTHRVMLAGALAALVAPVLPHPAVAAGSVVGAVAGELFIGLAIGFVATLVLTAVQTAAETVGLQMGLGIGAAYDPSLGGEASPLARLHEYFALALFLALNAHHAVLGAVTASFQRMPAGGAGIDPRAAAGIVALGGKVLRSGLELAAPLIAVLFTVNVVLALLTRMLPQLHIFVVGVPITIAAGLIALAESTEHSLAVLGRLIAELATDLQLVFGGGVRGF